MQFFLRHVTRKGMLVSHFADETVRESPVAETDFPGEKHLFTNNWTVITKHFLQMFLMSQKTATQLYFLH